MKRCPTKSAICMCNPFVREGETLILLEHKLGWKEKELGVDCGLPREKLVEWALEGESSLEAPKQNGEVGHPTAKRRGKHHQKL